MRRLRLLEPALLLALASSAACTREFAVFERTTPSSHDASATPDAGDAAEPDAGTDAGADAGSSSARDARAITAFQQTCAIAEGRLFCWGDNQNLQLGVGDHETRTTPTQVTEHALFLDVCAGEAHTCALREDGVAMCWGDNFTGALGVGDNDPRDHPTPVGSMHFAKLACWANVSCAIDLQGGLFCWGENFEGQLGQGDPVGSPHRSSPTAVAPALRFRELSVGQGHVCAITQAGELYCWGRNTQKQLGAVPHLEQARAPTRVDPERLYRKVAAGMLHTCAIDRSGQLLCWGQEGRGFLGLALASNTVVETPARVGNESDYTTVRASWFHTCAIRSNGFLSCWGRNVEGQLGVSDTDDRNVPVRVGTGSDWLDVAPGHFHTCGLRPDGVYCWGENDDAHQLGLGAPGRRSEPTLVPLSP